MLHSYCNAVKITGSRSLFLVAGTQRSPICTMRCRPSDANLLMEDLATIIPKVWTKNSLRVVAGGRGDGSKVAPHGGNLPLETTSFIGRERKLGEVEGLLGRTRLLTLTGVGGSGKTRLALRVAGDLRTSFGAGTGGWIWHPPPVRTLCKGRSLRPWAWPSRRDARPAGCSSSTWNPGTCS
jgi:hypothetical protein